MFHHKRVLMPEAGDDPNRARGPRTLDWPTRIFRRTIIGDRMAKVTVRMYASLREAAGASEIRTSADDLAELLASLSRRYPSLAKLLERARVERDRIVVLLNGHNIGSSEWTSVKLSDGDEVAFFPPVSGG